MKRTWTPREFEKMLKANGCTFTRFNGDHKIYKTPDGHTISFTVRGGMNRMVAQRLIKENGLVIIQGGK